MKAWNFDESHEIRLNGLGQVTFSLRDLAVQPGQTVSLKKDFDPDFTGGLTDKAEALERVDTNRGRLAALQEVLYADNRYALLIIIQGIDTAGKDGAIRHVMSGVNPQGCHVTSFKAPSEEELDHDYLWRAHKVMPPRGTIGIFNRSYYEEVLVVRVHEALLAKQRLPDEFVTPEIWQQRFEDMNAFERYLTRNGVVILKFFLNLSKKEQKKRLLARIDEEDKNWKFNVGDLKERAHWNTYRAAYEDMLSQTSTPWAPWWVIPADNKWFSRLVISEIIALQLEHLDIRVPSLTAAQKAELVKARQQLMAEKD